MLTYNHKLHYLSWIHILIAENFAYFSGNIEIAIDFFRLLNNETIQVFINCHHLFFLKNYLKFFVLPDCFLTLWEKNKTTLLAVILSHHCSEHYKVALTCKGWGKQTECITDMIVCGPFLGSQTNIQIKSYCFEHNFYWLN